MKKTLLSLLVGATVIPMAAQVPLPEVQFDAQKSRAKVQQMKQPVVKGCYAVPQLRSVNAQRLPQPLLKEAKARWNPSSRSTHQIHSQLSRSTVYSTPKNTAGMLNEGFETWDGVTADWLPEGWTEKISNPDFIKMEEGRFTWHTCYPSSVAPTEGRSCAAIYYAQVPDPNDSTKKKHLDLPQDEWLISPVFTPQDGDRLLFDLGYAPLFLFNLNPGYVDFGTFEFINRQPSTTLKVMVRPEGGEWEELFDVYDEWKDLSLQELFNQYMETAFRSYNLPLDRFMGKKVQVAFRFVGQYGNTMYLDAVKCGKNSLYTDYRWPAGSFYWAYDDNLNTLHDPTGRSFMLVAPYTDLTWTNLSDEAATHFTWQYADPSSPWSYLTTESKDLTMSYPFNAYAIPVLTSHADGYANGTYAWDGMSFQAGGTGIYPGPDGQMVFYGMSRFDPREPLLMVPDVNDGPLFGHHKKSRDTWSNLFRLEGEDWGELQAVGNIFEAPAAPYLVDRVRMYGLGEVQDDAELIARIYRITPDGKMGDEIGRGTCKGKDVLKLNDNILNFGFSMSRLSADGQLLNEPVVVNSEVMVLVDGLMANNKVNFGVLHAEPKTLNHFIGGYVFVNFQIGGQQIQMNPYPTSSFYGSNGPLFADFAITMDAVYNWLFAGAESVDVSAEGGVFSIPVSTYLSVWEISIKDDTALDKEWIKATVEDNGQTLQLRVDELQNDNSERSCSVIIKGWGTAKDTIRVKQSGSAVGIEQQAYQQDKVVMRGTLLQLQSNTAHQATLYDASGRQVMQWTFQNGHSVVSLQALPKGIYVVRLDNGANHRILR